MAMEEGPRFYRVFTDPDAGLRSQETLEWEMSRAGDRAGPFVAPHLSSLGIGLTSLGSGFPREAPPDRIVYKLNPRRRVRDFESGGAFWIISHRAHDVLDKFARTAIDSAPAIVHARSKQGKDIEIPGRLLCDVIQFEDVVDEAASKIEWSVGQAKYGVGSLFTFKPNLPSDLHLFRIWKQPRTIVCSAALRGELERANLTGVAFGRLDIIEFD